MTHTQGDDADVNADANADAHAHADVDVDPSLRNFRFFRIGFRNKKRKTEIKALSYFFQKSANVDDLDEVERRKEKKEFEN